MFPRTKMRTGLVTLLIGITCLSCTVGADTQESSTSLVARACDLPERFLVRIWRGYSPGHSEEIHFVPREPNFVGSFNIPSHTGPWDYVQRIPLVLYGPQHIAARGDLIGRNANLTDVYPTLARLLDADVEVRSGRVLKEALRPEAPAARPKLVVVIVWDGVGQNVLDSWTGQWPVLERLEREGTSYAATVGSSPSVTPSAHSSIGTGAWPREHEVSAIKLRSDGKVVGAFSGYKPADLRLATIGDQYDVHTGNRALVGMVGWREWHMGMLGHGRAYPRGDRDVLVSITRDGTIETNRRLFTVPRALLNARGRLDARADELDLADGRADGRWRGHDILDRHQSPAWVNYEADLLLRLVRSGRFGADGVPDLLFANFKMTDIAGHQFGIDSPEMADNLAAQDAALGRIIDYLDSHVGDYVVIVTADHGHTPPAPEGGGWPISLSELIKDLNRHFGVEPGHSLVQDSHAVGLFMDAALLEDLDVSLGEVAEWLTSYTLEDNVAGDEIPRAYRSRSKEEIFAAAFPTAQLPQIMDCALGTSTPGAWVTE